MYEAIRYEVVDPAATITLNRPDSLNAWTGQMELEVRDAVGRAERDPTVVGIILTGAGRAFCAGADTGMLKAVESGSSTGLSGPELRGPDAVVPGEPSWGRDLRGAYSYLMSVPKPVIAAINGAAAGMALPLMLACDLRFMAVEATLTTAFSRLGLVAEYGTSWMLPRLIGTGAALDLLFSSREVTGVEAERLGLVNRVVPDGQVVEVAREYLIRLASTTSPTSLALVKRQVYQQLHRGLAEAEAEAQRLMEWSLVQSDFAEGVTALVERRAPHLQRRGSDAPPLPPSTFVPSSESG